MNWRIAVIASALTAMLSGQSAGLTDEEVDAAINAAKQPRWTSMFVEAKGRFAAYYSVLLQGPVGRTMDLAREAFESYKPLKVSDVPPETRAHEVTFTVVTHSGTRGGIKNIVIMPPGATSQDAAIQPMPPRRRDPLTRLISRDVRPRMWKPGLGSEPSGLPFYYRCAEVALPPGDLQVIVVTDSGEERYTVRVEERERIR